MIFMVDEIVLKVAKRRMREIKTELPHPDIATHFSEGANGIGQIDLFFQGDLIGREFVETAISWKDKGRMDEYRRVLQQKLRLVVMAPRIDAMKVRMMMLELNNWWLFYYMVYGYDSQGRLVRVLRPIPPDKSQSYIT